MDVELPVDVPATNYGTIALLTTTVVLAMVTLVVKKVNSQAQEVSDWCSEVINS